MTYGQKTDLKTIIKGDQLGSLSHDGLQRSYRLYLPPEQYMTIVHKKHP